VAGDVTALRIGLCAVAALLGLAALALAHDVHGGRSALERGDARFATHPATARWEASTWLPGDPALRALGAVDDVRLRKAERAFDAVANAPRGLDDGRRAAELNAGTAVALADVVGTGSPAQASRAGNLLGILTGSQEEGPAAAAELFDAAVRADLSNTYAKHNLELVLRRLRVVGTREGEGQSVAGDYGQALEGAGAGLPGQGY
jgi:hypothetical protein